MTVPPAAGRRSCSAARRRSTTCRSCRGPRSPRPCAASGSGRGWLVDLAGRWWWLPAGHRAAAGRRPPTTTRPRSAPTARWRRRGPRPARRGRPRPVVFLALHGPFGEDGTVQALCEAAGLAYTGSGVAASAIGWTRRCSSGCVRGLGLPVVDWREVRAARWARDREGVLAELEAFAAGTGDPRLMVKPARLGSSVGMTLAHGPAERAGRARRRRSGTTTSRSSSATSPGARDLEVAVIGNEPDALELYGPGEILSGHEFYDYAAKYTPGLSRDDARRRGEPTPRATILKLARDAYRADRLRGLRADRLPASAARARRVRDQHDPGVHADQPVPGAARRGRLRLRGRRGADRRAGARAPGGRVRRRLIPGDLPR